MIPAGLNQVEAGAMGAAVLLLGDDPAFEAFRSAVAYVGFEGIAAGDSADCLNLVAGRKPDLVVAAPSVTGMAPDDFARAVGAAKLTETLPVLFVDGAGDGRAPDPRPFEAAVLEIRAALRRERPGAFRGLQAARSFVLDAARFRLCLGDRTCALSKSDLCLIGPFFDAPDRVFDRPTLGRLVFGARADRPADRRIDVYLGRLRRTVRTTLGADPIRSVRGQGYSIA